MLDSPYRARSSRGAPKEPEPRSERSEISVSLLVFARTSSRASWAAPPITERRSAPDRRYHWPPTCAAAGGAIQRWRWRAQSACPCRGGAGHNEHSDRHVEWEWHLQPRARGNARPLPRRWLERTRRPESDRRRAHRHSLELRRHDGEGAGHSARDRSDDRLEVELSAAFWVYGLRLALRSRRAVLAIHERRDEPELPARRASRGRQWKGGVHVDLPGVLLGPLAAHSLRGLSEPDECQLTATLQVAV